MVTPARGRARAAELWGRLDERGFLDRLIDAVRAGESQALVLVGEAQRLLAAARAKHAAGALDGALGLLVAAEAGPPDALRTAEVEHLRGQIASQQRRSSDGARLLLSAARRLERLDAALARETYLEALAVAVWAGDLGLPGGVRQPPRPRAPRRPPPTRRAWRTSCSTRSRCG
jgi:hypothetical protein